MFSLGFPKKSMAAIEKNELKMMRKNNEKHSFSFLDLNVIKFLILV